MYTKKGIYKATNLYIVETTLTRRRNPDGEGLVSYNVSGILKRMGFFSAK
jgi:hypothetical protein